MTGALASVSSLTAGFVGLSAVLGAGSSFNTFTAFNRSLTEVSTLTQGTAINIGELEKAAKSMAIQFGSQPIEQSKAFYQVISAGASTASEAIDILTAANKLAVGGVTDIETAADGLTSILNSYGDAAGSAADVSDSLFVAMKAGKTTIGELSAGLGKVTPFASALGVSFDELTAATAALTKGGISTRESISGLRAILAAVVKPTKDAADQAAEIGLEFNSAAIEAQGFAGFLQDVVDKTGGSVDELAKLFGGVEAIVPIMALAGAAGEDFNDTLDDMATKAGATETAFTQMAESPGFKVDQFMAAISVAGISLGAVLSDVLLPGLTRVTAAFNEFFSTMEENQSVLDKIFTSDVFLRFVEASGLLGTILVKRVRQQKAVEESTRSLNKLTKDSLALWSDLAGNVGQAGTSLDKFEKATEDTTIKTNKLAKSLKSVTIEQLIQRESTARIIDLSNEVNRITESVATEQERYNETLRELERLKPYLSVETYTRALQQAEDELNNVEEKTRVTTDRVSQLWVQAGRNIQSTLARSIFNFFDDGLKGMVKNVGRAVGQIASEFAALRLGQALGFNQIFGGSAASGGGGGGFDALDGANLISAGNTLYQGFSGALAANAGSLIAGVGGALGSGSSAAFGTALGGDAIGGLIAGTEAGLSGAAAAEAASAGATAASGATAATGFGLLALATSIGNQLIANNKEIGGRTSDELNNLNTTFESVEGFIGSLSAIGTGLTATRLLGEIPGIGGFLESAITPFIPDIGGFLTSLFGRGAPKLRETNLIGQATAEGFSGVTSSKIKQEGGLFAGDKTRRVIIDADTLELSDGSTRKFGDFADNLKPSIELLNFTLDGALKLINQNVSDTSKLLGLGSTEGFSTNINIASQKGQFFTADEITAELARIEEEFIRFVEPAIDSLARGGETLVEAFQRLGFEFEVLTGLGNALGNSTESTQDFLRDISAGARSGLVAQLGGADRVTQFSQFFFDNFLTESQRSKIAVDNLAISLTEAGFAADLSVEQYGDLVKSFGQVGGIAVDQLNNLIGLGSQLLSVRGTGGSGANSSDDAFNALSNSINARQSEIATELAGVSSVISELSGVTNLLGSAVNTIQPIGRQQARSLINQAANDSNFNDPRLGFAIDALTKSSTEGFATRIDFLSDQAKSSESLRELQDAAGAQLSIEEQTLSALELESLQLDNMLSNAQSQLDELNGINTNTLTIAEALAAFNGSLAGEVAQDSNAVTGSPSGPTVSQISGSQISNFIANNPDPFAIHAAAVLSGVSASRLAANSEFTVDQINAFTDANDLPPLATGTNLIPNDMPIFAHKGETVTPRAFVEQDAVERKQMITLLGDILTELKKIDISTDQAAEILNDASAGGPLLVELESAA
tara:strand:+ start:728 stop:4870 length:4143 start_codon:yes stop_codon:yes gene_type:complete